MSDTQVGTELANDHVDVSLIDEDGMAQPFGAIRKGLGDKHFAQRSFYCFAQWGDEFLTRAETGEPDGFFIDGGDFHRGCAVVIDVVEGHLDGGVAVKFFPTQVVFDLIIDFRMKAEHGLAHQFGRLELQDLIGDVDLWRGIGQTVETGLPGCGVGILEHHRGIGRVAELSLGVFVPCPTAEDCYGEHKPEPVVQQVFKDVERVDVKAFGSQRTVGLKAFLFGHFYHVDSMGLVVDEMGMSKTLFGDKCNQRDHCSQERCAREDPLQVAAGFLAHLIVIGLDIDDVVLLEIEHRGVEYLLRTDVVIENLALAVHFPDNSDAVEFGILTEVSGLGDGVEQGHSVFAFYLNGANFLRLSEDGVGEVNDIHRHIGV